MSLPCKHFTPKYYLVCEFSNGGKEGFIRFGDAFDVRVNLHILPYYENQNQNESLKKIISFRLYFNI
jgi:hypothetical protein